MKKNLENSLKFTGIRDEQILENARNSPCIINNYECKGRTQPEHVSTRGSWNFEWIIYDGEKLLNVMPICPVHHDKKNKKGYSYMIKMYPRYLMWLMKERRVDIIQKSMRK